MALVFDDIYTQTARIPDALKRRDTEVELYFTNHEIHQAMVQFGFNYDDLHQMIETKKKMMTDMFQTEWNKPSTTTQQFDDHCWTYYESNDPYPDEQ